MAVVAPPPFRTKSDRWGPAGDSTSYDFDPTGPMTRIMSYQYPPPPSQNGADMDLPPSGYIPDYSSLQASADTDPRAADPQGLERSLSFSKSMKLKRSMSTPVVTPEQPVPLSQQISADSMVADTAALALANEKRRNKLGYHRTSVACGHCRRRKIRCIPSPADVQGRCVNCIRLKKECSFYPVDQPPTPDARQKQPGSRSSVGPKMSSASSSPAMAPGLPSDMPGQQAQYPQMGMGSVQGMGAPGVKPSQSDSFPPDAKMPSGVSAGRSFDYNHAGMTNWMTAEAGSGTSKPGDLHATWRTYPAESPVTPAFSPYTPTAPPPGSAWTTPASGGPPREDLGWSSYPAPAGRSMSFGTAEMLGSHHQQYAAMPHGGGQAATGRAFDRKSGSMSEMYPAPMTAAIPGIESVPNTTLEHHAAALSAGAVPATTYGAWQQPYAYAKGDAYGEWYGDGGHQLAPEEHVQHSTEHGQSGTNMYYSGR